MTIHELQDRKNALAVEIKAHAARQAEWNADDQTKWEQLNADYDKTCGEIAEERERLTKSEAVQKRLQEIEDANKADLGDRRVGPDQQQRDRFNPERQDRQRIDVPALAFQAWLRAGRGMDLTPEQLSACRQAGVRPGAGEIDLGMPRWQYSKPAFTELGGVSRCREFRAGLDVATGGAGVETIPEGFMAELERRTLEFAHVRQVCRVIATATGNAMPWPTVDDTGNTGVLLAEATTFGTSVDPTFAAVTFNAYKYSSKPVFASAEILEDSAFNLAAEIASLLGERLGRIEGSQTTTADGSAKPKGIVACAGTGVTSASATVITADEILGLIHSLDPSYRMNPSVGFMMHDTALLYIRKIKLADGQYLWQPGFQTGVPDRLCGYPVAINQAMEPLVSNLPVTAKKHVLFGDFSKYIIRDVASVRFYRLDERYRDTDQTAFIAFKRLDGDSIQVNALKVLLQA